MCAQENKRGLPPFWEKRGELFFNSLTCFSAKETPERLRGGILADDMGLVSEAGSSFMVNREATNHFLIVALQGKTLTTIALILTNFHEGKRLPVGTCVAVSQQVK